MVFNPFSVLRRSFRGLKRFEFMFPVKGIEDVTPLVDRLYGSGVLYADIEWSLRNRTDGMFGAVIETYCYMTYWAKAKVLGVDQYEEAVAQKVCSDLVNLNDRISEFERRMESFEARMESLTGK